MDDLISWLDKQLDADEQTATAARDAEFCKDGRWMVKGPFEESLGSIHSEAGEAILGEEESLPFVMAEHIARHNPTRILAEVDAKRRMIGRINSHAAIMSWDEVHGDLLRSLALPYSDRPGYREEWRP